MIGLCSFNEDGKLAGMAFHPVVIGGNEAVKSDALERRLAPELVRGADAERILHRFREQSAKVGTDIEVSNGVGVLNI